MLHGLQFLVKQLHLIFSAGTRYVLLVLNGNDGLKWLFDPSTSSLTGNYTLFWPYRNEFYLIPPPRHRDAVKVPRPTTPNAPSFIPTPLDGSALPKRVLPSPVEQEAMLNNTTVDPVFRGSDELDQHRHTWG
ncbi:hypothetical protein FIE12Z_8027 [Fusarium flagelliforme]|uniref:Uncharacterized protein n=1 Tax=Fusarium flagelliforme TaxID=2675880 RepID=A0A395MK88_9HYPO|nr:hypothetical protein FIE12Z_8027 [Fusarium flagelliforme]